MSSALHGIYEGAISFENYLPIARANADRFRSVHERLAFVASDPESRIFPHDLRILALSEPYCADCVLNLPLIARLAEASDTAAPRVASHERHKEVADRFPGRGGISRLPTVILLDCDWDVVGYWSERSTFDHAWMSGFTRSNPLPEITLEGGIPAGPFSAWLERRFDDQLPVFLEQGWRHVRRELREVAEAAPRAAWGPSPRKAGRSLPANRCPGAILAAAGLRRSALSPDGTAQKAEQVASPSLHVGEPAISQSAS